MHFDSSTPQALYDAIDDTMKNWQPSWSSPERGAVRITANGNRKCPDLPEVCQAARECALRLRRSDPMLSKLPDPQDNPREDILSIQEWCIGGPGAQTNTSTPMKTLSHRETVNREIVNEVARNIAFFRRKWAELAQQVEICGKELRRCQKQPPVECAAIVERLEQAKNDLNVLSDLHKAGYRRWTSLYADWHMLRLPVTGPVYAPTTVVNPLLWLQNEQPNLHGYDKCPSETQLLLDCAILAAVHDAHVSDGEPHICVTHPNTAYNEDSGPFFREHDFCEYLKRRYTEPNEKGEVERAWGRAREDLLKRATPPLGGGAETPVVMTKDAGADDDQVHVDLSQWNEPPHGKGGSRTFMHDLLKDKQRKGVKRNVRRHGDGQPGKLNQLLKAKYGPGHIQAVVIKGKKGYYKLNVSDGSITFDPPND